MKTQTGLEVGEGWRLLQNGEVIIEGDEVDANGFGERWIPTTLIGRAWRADDWNAVRRRVPVAPSKSDYTVNRLEVEGRTVVSISPNYPCGRGSAHVAVSLFCSPEEALTLADQLVKAATVEKT